MKLLFSTLTFAIICLLAACGAARHNPAGDAEALDSTPVGSALPGINQLDAMKGASLAGFTRLGNEFQDSNAISSVENTSIRLGELIGQQTYAIYRFDSSAVDELASVGYTTSEKATGFSPIYMLLADYTYGRWRMIEFNQPADNFSVGGDPGQYTSPGGYTYLAMLGYDGEYYLLDSVEVYFSNIPTDLGAWPTAGGSNQRRGYSADNVVESANVHWKTVLPKSLLHSAPVQNADGTIFLGSYEPVEQKGSLFALDTDGSLLWEHEVLDQISSTPAIGPQGHVVFGDIADYVYAVNRAGIRAWHTKLPREVYSSPAILDDGSIIVGTQGSQLYKLDYLGIEQWHLDTSSGIYCPPAIAADGTIYVCTAGGALASVSPDGELNWEHSGTGEAHASPCITSTGKLVYATQDGNIYSVDADGNQLGTHAAGTSFEGAPAEGPDGNIYIANMDGKLYKYDSDANLLDTFITGSPIEGSVVIDGDGTVFFGTASGSVYAVTPDLQLQWQYDSDVSYRCGLAICEGGMLLAPATDGTLTAFAPNDAVIPAQPTGLTASQGTFADYVQLSWDEQFDANGFDIYRDGSGSPVDSVVGLFSWFDEGLSDDTHHTYTIVATNETGSSIASESAEGWAIGIDPGAGDWNMYCADPAHTGLSSLAGPHDGQLDWSYETGITGHSSPVIGAFGEIYFTVGVDNPYVYSLAQDGSLRWATARNQSISAGLAIDDNGYIYGSESDYIFRLKPDGSEDWSVTYTNGNFGPPTLHEDSVYYSGEIFSGPDLTLKLAMSDGSETWSYSKGSRFGAPSIGSDGRVYVCGGSNRVYIVNTDGSAGGELGASGTVDETAVILHDVVNGDFVAATSGPKLYAWKNGSFVFSYPADNDDVTGIALMPGLDNLVTIGDECSRIDLTGAELWTGTLSRKTQYAMPSVDKDGYIYYGDNLGILRCVAPNGDIAWDYDTETDLAYSSVAIGPDNRVYILGANGTLFAFENPAP
ncbi:PQQ-binding-like beta-propeller repeat protein [bacterium]|nr:PQQ-binding-like beta-propeller repeat protein [bacterium]